MNRETPVEGASSTLPGSAGPMAVQPPAVGQANGNQRLLGAVCKRSAWDTKHGNGHRHGDDAPRLSRMVLVSGMRFSDWPMCSRQRRPTLSAVA